MGRVIHFEFLSDDPASAAKFMNDTFGWNVSNWGGPEDYWLISTGKGDPGIDGGMMKAGQAPFSSNVCNTIGVDNLDAMMKKVEDNGGKILTPKHPIPTVGWFCYAQTPDGMPFGMMQPDAEAK